MMTTLLLSLLLQVPSTPAAPLTGPELIAKSITHHDPDGRWGSWRVALTLSSENSKGKSSTSEVRFDNRVSSYAWSRTVAGTDVLIGVKGGSCFAEDAEGNSLKSEFVEEHRLGCPRTRMMRNYHTYLYGLPMKLRDAGTRIETKTHREDLDGQSYHVVRVPYEKDSWDFFIHPETFALEAYRFYMDEAANKGELIKLSGTETAVGIRLPKVRRWFNTHDGKHLGTDTIVSGERLRRRE